MALATRTQAERIFEILVDDLDVDPGNHDVFVHSYLQGAGEIQVQGFTDEPKRRQARLLLMPSDPRVLRCHRTDAKRLEREQHARLNEARWRLHEVVQAPPKTPRPRLKGPPRLRLSALAA